MLNRGTDAIHEQENKTYLDLIRLIVLELWVNLIKLKVVHGMEVTSMISCQVQ